MTLSDLFIVAFFVAVILACERGKRQHDRIMREEPAGGSEGRPPAAPAWVLETDADLVYATAHDAADALQHSDRLHTGLPDDVEAVRIALASQSGGASDYA